MNTLGIKSMTGLGKFKRKRTKDKNQYWSSLPRNRDWDQIQILQIEKADIQEYEQKFKKQTISDDVVNMLFKQIKTQFIELQRLNLSDLELTNKRLLNIYLCQSKFKNLRYIYLSSNQIGNKGILHLTRNQNVFKVYGSYIQMEIKFEQNIKAEHDIMLKKQYKDLYSVSLQ